MVECWQLWITVKAVLANQLHESNDIIAHHAKFVKFYCVWMSQVVLNKVADELKLKNLGRIGAFFCDVSLPDCAHM